jgi:flagellar hook assembly protein FlgD
MAIDTNRSMIDNKVDNEALFKALNGKKNEPVAKRNGGLGDSQTMMKLFMTQIKCQDPMGDKQDPTAMITQLAQMTQVEEATKSNAKLDNIVELLKSSKQFEAASLLSKKIIAPSNTVKLDNCDIKTENGKTNLSFDKLRGKIELPAIASSTHEKPKNYDQVQLKISLFDGREVGSMLLGSQASGATVQFDINKLENINVAAMSEADLAMIHAGEFKVAGQGLFNGAWNNGVTSVGTKISSVLIDGKDFVVSGDGSSKVKISDLNEIYE